MPKKYHIDARPAPPRFTPVGRFAIIDFNEDCAGACHNCVKKKCIYKNYEKESDFVRGLDRPVEFLNECMSCLCCVQNCTKGVVSRVVNPEYGWLGDDYWKPEQIMSIWNQATTGKIPVSGAGYGGPFSGPGFDSMWTDMSEIVRPTRDGIHGREYISTSVDLGAKLPALSFDDKDRLVSQLPPLIEIPVPFMIDTPPFGEFSENVFESLALAAKEMGTIFITAPENITKKILKYGKAVAPRLDAARIGKFRSLIKASALVELEDSRDVVKHVKKIKDINPGVIVSVRIPLRNDAPERASKLATAGVEVIHFHAGTDGMSSDAKEPMFIKDVFRNIHRRLVSDMQRDRVTLVASGGISMAEHMAKIIICGADCVTIGLPFLIAMECRMCGGCVKGAACPVEMSKIPPRYGADRIINLSSAWRNQLLEVLGAMGIREVRRLRAEFGRAMFMEDLEKDTFERIFAGRK